MDRDWDDDEDRGRLVGPFRQIFSLVESAAFLLPPDLFSSLRRSPGSALPRGWGRHDRGHRLRLTEMMGNAFSIHDTLAMPTRLTD